MKKLLAIAAAAGALMLSGTAFAGDAAKGKAVFEEVCSECHEAADFDGMKGADIVARTKDAKIAEKHKKKQMSATAEQIADVAAFLAKGK